MIRLDGMPGRAFHRARDVQLGIASRERLERFENPANRLRGDSSEPLRIPAGEQRDSTGWE